MAKQRRSTDHPRSRRNGRRPRAPRANPHKDTPAVDTPQATDTYVLAAIARRLEHVERLLLEQRRSSSRWLSPQEASKRLGIGAGLIRNEIKRAIEAGEDTIFGGRFHILKFGEGEERPRYRIWEPDLAEAKSA